ncbi:MAG: L,D-transpeptidase [Lachnospiraceae bacterium]|nr:L,D-transpeptidase [Lachnospiraceae bacterium]
MKHRVWKHAAVIALTLALTFVEFAGVASAKPADEKWKNRAVKIAARNPGTQTVRTVYWTAKLTKNVKGKAVRNTKNTKDTKIGKKVKIKKGTKVTIIQRDYHEKKGVSQCMLKNGREVYIKNKYLKITKALCTGNKGDYTKETKEAYVNGTANDAGTKRIESETSYLIWISLDKQRVNIFNLVGGKWKWLNTYKASTGKADAPTLDRSFLSRKTAYQVQWKKEKVENLKYYTAFYGSGIHKFPSSGMSKVIGIKPVSHSCVRIPEAGAIWIYKNIPVSTRVWVW